MNLVELEQALNKASATDLTRIATRCLELLDEDDAIELIVAWADLESCTLSLFDRLEEEL